MATTIRSTNILKFATIEDLLANKPMIVGERKRTKNETKLAAIKAKAKGQPYLLCRDNVGFTLIHVNSGLESTYDKLGNPRNKHEIKWIPYLTIRRYCPEIYRLGVYLPLSLPS